MSDDKLRDLGWLTIDDVAAALHVSRRKVQRMIADGGIPAEPATCDLAQAVARYPAREGQGRAASGTAA